MPDPSARKPIPRIFISSTFEDLQGFRQATFDAIHSLGAYGDNMIHWSADERSGKIHSIERVRQSDLLILIVAHRYGYVPTGEDISVTHQEYRAAQAGRIPVLAFFVDEEAPWPPNQIEHNRRTELQAFKREVEQAVTRKLFRSSDELGRLVTQALAQFIERHRESLATLGRFGGTTLQVDPSTRLETAPDAGIRIGTAEDGLPLIFQVRRARDLSPHLGALSRLVASESKPAPLALISSFRQALEEHAHDAWASERLVQVHMNDGSVRRHYVSTANLTQLFRSTFAALLKGMPVEAADGRATQPRTEREPARTVGTIATVQGRPATVRRRSAPQFATVTRPSVIPATVIQIASPLPDAATSMPFLQSTGGANRFLAVEPPTGALCSVGRDGTKWVEWRPFLFESLHHHFKTARVRIRSQGTRECLIEDLPRALFELALRAADDQGQLSPRVSVVVSRQAIAESIAAVAREVAAGHAAGIIHGDLKPANVLLCADGARLIDAFGLADGAISPGWTPGWSAPEQVLGEPIGFSSDVFPLGMMIVELMGGQLVGEVRKFRTPSNSARPEEDVFYNPSVFVAEDPGQKTLPGALVWRAFAASCLRFDPDQRPANAEAFQIRLTQLLSEFPLQGDVSIPMPGDLRVATLLDGSQAVARIIRDAEP
jgi:hypothetical protein